MSHDLQVLPPRSDGKCQYCGGETASGYGLAGGGIGLYTYCEACGRITDKTQDPEMEQAMPKPRTPTYDTKCYGLAEHFLEGSDAGEPERKALAAHIQTAIEDWIEGWIADSREQKP